MCVCVWQAGSFEYTRRKLIDLEEKLVAEISRLGGNLLLLELVHKLSEVYRHTH